MKNKSIMICVLFTVLSNIIWAAIVIFYVQNLSGIVTTPVDSDWNGWENSDVSFGFDEKQSQIAYFIDAPVQVNGTLISRSSSYWNKRWGFHVFDGFAGNGSTRVSLLVGKHNEHEKNVAELYCYDGEHTESATSYGWTRVGSDVSKHSFLFSRDEMVAYGEVKLDNLLTLAKISPSKDFITRCETVEEADEKYDPEVQPEENAKCLLYIAIQNADDGAIYYNIDADAIMVKIAGTWKVMQVVDEKT